MRLFLGMLGLFALGICGTFAPPVWGQDAATSAWALEAKGDGAQARDLLRKAAEQNPPSVTALRAYAEFLGTHRDPAAREAYARLETALTRANAPQDQITACARREAMLDLLAGDNAAATRHLDLYRNSGGSGLSFSPAPETPVLAVEYINVPGPLRSFARMAALSPEGKPKELLAALARNVVTNGYQATPGSESLGQTEYLKLIIRYLSQAREITKFAGEKSMIHIETCESSETGDLLRILGYRMRGGCASDVVLETVNASRAFLTIDSGFPIAQLEQDLRTNHPFELDYHPARVPVMFKAEYWQSLKEKSAGEFIDYFLSDPSLCRLYLGLSKLDPETSTALREEIPAQRLKTYAHILDFFGGMFEIRDGKAIVPGGARAEKTWADLVGASPDKGAAFLEKVLIRDDGWLASYYDALARINGPVRDYLTDPERLKRFYTAIRGRVTSPGPARPVFQSNTDMLLLTTRLRMDPNGKPHLPGNLDVWKNLFINHPMGKYDAKLTHAAPAWKDSDDVPEALFGLCRKVVENEPLKIFMALSDVERNRAQPLEPSTVDRLAKDYKAMGAQYPLFSEAPAVSDKTILTFLDTAESVAKTRDPALRSDAAGIVQGLIVMWQVLIRDGAIPESSADATLAGLLEPFAPPAKALNHLQLFDGGRAGVKLLLAATHSPADVTVQDRVLDLMAGANPDDSSDAHQHILEDMSRIFEAQKLVSLTTLFDLADNLESVGRGEKLNTALAQKLANRISEIQLPRSALTAPEKTLLTFGYWSDQHVDAQRKLNLRAQIEKLASDPQKLKDLRGTLTPFLRDTLVGFAYIHYAPPGAEILRTNPLFVRSHDFIGMQSANSTWKSTEMFGTGWPANAGGRLVGSLGALPYALAEAEENFLIPSRDQALIWGDLVPQMILSAVVPRWGNVSPAQLHWVGAHMALAENVLAESVLDPQRRAEAMAVLYRFAPPARLRKIEHLLASGDVRGAAENIMPSEMYLLAADLAPKESSPNAAEIRRIAALAPGDVNASRDFARLRDS